MKLVTRAELARICGITRAAVGLAIERGSVVLVGEGRTAKIDLTDDRNADYINLDRVVKPQAVEKPAGKNPTTTAPAPKKPQISSLDDINEENLFLLTKADIDKLKAYEQALAARLKREEQRGTLISRKLVRQVFAKLYTVDNNELKAMEERLTSSICGVFDEHDDSLKAVEIRKMLNVETTKSLRHIKRIMNDHLAASGSAPV